MYVIYSLSNGKRYACDEFNAARFCEKDGKLYCMAGRKPKELGLIVAKETCGLGHGGHAEEK